MSKDNRDFFKQKSEWAKTKDELLKSYLVPYTTKIQRTGKGLLYIDSFAGKGMFDDGSKGSPIIACESIYEAVRLSKAQNKNLNLLFVEKTYASELIDNLRGYPSARAVEGTFELLSQELMNLNVNTNLFLYVDPFGVRSLDMQFFLNIAKRFNTVEILLNLNSFGFFRAACSIYGILYEDIESFEEIIEREDHSSGSITQATQMLNKAADGTYWQDIVKDYRAHRIDGYEAESRFANEFCEHLRTSYAYVLN